MHFISLACIWSCLVYNVYVVEAVPANPSPFTAYQPDGTPITLMVKGDEDRNWLQDVNGYTVVATAGPQLASDDAGPPPTVYVYATVGNNGELQTTDLQVGKSDPAQAGVEMEAALLASNAAEPLRLLQESLPPGLSQGTYQPPVASDTLGLFLCIVYNTRISKNVFFFGVRHASLQRIYPAYLTYT